MLAARISGDAKTSFPGGKPGAAPATDKKDGDKPAATEKDKLDPNHTPYRARSTPSSSLTAICSRISFGSAAGPDGARGGRAHGHNAALLLSALENLSGSNALIALRGRGVNERPFHLGRGSAPQRRAPVPREGAVSRSALKTAKMNWQSSRRPARRVSCSRRRSARRPKSSAEMLDTRRELREVKRALRSDIDALDGWLKFANIALVPLMIALGGLGLAAVRGAGRRKS